MKRRKVRDKIEGSDKTTSLKCCKTQELKALSRCFLKEPIIKYSQLESQFWRHWVHLVIMTVANKTDSFIYNLTAGKRHESALKPHICNYLIYDRDVNRTTVLKVTAQSGREWETGCGIVILNYTFLTPVLMKHQGQKELTFRTPVSLSFLSFRLIYSPSKKSLKLNLAKQRPSLTKMIIYQNPTRGTETAKRENTARKG